MNRVLVVSTTTHDPAVSTSVAMLTAVLRHIKAEYNVQFRMVDADKLHIVQNLSCYANGKKDCANPSAGPYRCWAHQESVSNPTRFGGVDQMPVIYDGIGWADTVIWGTSTRWGSHSALMQKIIERLNTLENRSAAWGEKNPLTGKMCGVVVGGLNWKTKEVALHLKDVFRILGFTVPDRASLFWQLTSNLNYEQPSIIKPCVEEWLGTAAGVTAVSIFAESLLRPAVGDR
jgi:multimeric flavodoxin WrbA